MNFIHILVKSLPSRLFISRFIELVLHYEIPAAIKKKKKKQAAQAQGRRPLALCMYRFCGGAQPASVLVAALHMPVLCPSRCQPAGEVWALYEAPPGLRAHGL